MERIRGVVGYRKEKRGVRQRYNFKTGQPTRSKAGYQEKNENTHYNHAARVRQRFLRVLPSSSRVLTGLVGPPIPHDRVSVGEVFSRR